MQVYLKNALILLFKVELNKDKPRTVSIGRYLNSPLIFYLNFHPKGIQKANATLIKKKYK